MANRAAKCYLSSGADDRAASTVYSPPSPRPPCYAIEYRPMDERPPRQFPRRRSCQMGVRAAHPVVHSASLPHILVVDGVFGRVLSLQASGIAQDLDMIVLESQRFLLYRALMYNVQICPVATARPNSILSWYI